MSDVVATTPEAGAAIGQEAQFQSFWDNAAATEAERPRDDAQQASAAADEQQDQAADPNAEAQQQEAEQPDDTPQYASLSELLTAHKIDPESVLGLHVTTKIDGVETQVPLADVIKSYQLEGHVNNKSIELSNQKTAFDQEQQQWRQAAQQQLQTHQAMAQAAMQMLNHDYQKVDWNTLRVQNPAEFAALQAEFQQRQGQIGQFVTQVQMMAQQEEQQKRLALQQSLAQENDRLMNARPEWRNPDAFNKARDSMKQYARSLGFQDAELNSIYDHRYMLILSDAASYRALQAATPQALKQVRQAPPMAKPGSRVDVNPQEAKKQQALDRLKRNPRDQDAQAAAFDFFANQ
jgi:hypothetical protein